jgi:regulator of replication initiation timing
MVRDLGAQLATANDTIKQLRLEHNNAARAVTNSDRRWGWIETENNGLRTERDRLKAERDTLSIENTELRQRIAQLTQITARPPAQVPPPRPLSRAERRQQERQQRRRQP